MAGPTPGRPLARPMIPAELRQSFARRQWCALARSLSPVLPMLARALSRRSSLVTTNGLRLTVAPGVFHPTLYATTLVFAEYLHSLDLDGKRVLEMGTGSGMLAMEAARRGAQVVAADINPAAVSCARENAARNGLATRVTVIESDLFASLASDQRFDII